VPGATVVQGKRFWAAIAFCPGDGVETSEQLSDAGYDSDEPGFAGRDGGKPAAELSSQAKVVLSATLQCGSHEHSLTTSFSGGQAT
jgi:hypothetical protein